MLAGALEPEAHEIGLPPLFAFDVPTGLQLSSSAFFLLEAANESGVVAGAGLSTAATPSSPFADPLEPRSAGQGPAPTPADLVNKVYARFASNEGA